jgi:hypothetical protein
VCVSQTGDTGDFYPSEANILDLISRVRQPEAKSTGTYMPDFSAISRSVKVAVGYEKEEDAPDAPYGENEVYIEKIELRLRLGRIPDHAHLTRRDTARVFAMHVRLLMETFNMRFGSIVYVNDCIGAEHGEIINKILGERKR